MNNSGNTELNYCYHCMTRLKSGQTVCPVCGHDNTLHENPGAALPEGTMLAGKFLVGEVLGQGGFGITYLGFDTSLDVKVAIKEYFPYGIGVRAPNSIRVTAVTYQGKADGFRKGCDEFQAEAKRLAPIESPNIVKVREYFRENGTAYIVMSFLDGNSLTKEAAACGGKMPWKRVVDLFKPLILEMDKLHKAHMIHRDIKPDNIKVVKDDEGGERLVLLDFGAARSFVSAEVTGTYSAMVTHGYAPVEQYSPKSRQGPYTDIYALCATMYAVITGNLPATATDRMTGEADIKTFTEMGVEMPPHIEKAILHGLEVRSQDRPQSMKELYDELEGKEPAGRGGGTVPVEKPAPELKPEERPSAEVKPAPQPEPKPKVSWLVPVLLAVLAAVGFFIYRGIKKSQQNTAAAQTSVAATSAQIALDLAARSTQNAENAQTAQAGLMEQAAAARTQTARETQAALSVQQTGTAWNLTAAAELQQTLTQAAIDTGATQAEQEIRVEQTVQVETQAAVETASVIQSEGTATAWFTTQEVQLHQTETRVAEEERETQAFFTIQTATQAALEQREAAFHVMETEAAFAETQVAIDMRMTGVAATKTKAAEPTATPTPEATATATMTNTPEPTATPTKKPLLVGDIVVFGQYEQDDNTANGAEAIEWQVLAVEDGRALVISKYGLVAKPYNEKNASVTWETCTLRTWLNGEFYNSAFSEAEKVQIQEVRITNPNNPTYGTKGGNDTKDRIFLLSIEEAKKYFTNDEARKCWPTTYADNNGAYVREDRGGTTWWWLRSPGYNARYAVDVTTNGSLGDSGGRDVFLNDVVARPAFWLNLDEGGRSSEGDGMGEPSMPTDTPAPTVTPESTNTPLPTETPKITDEYGYYRVISDTYRVITDTFLRNTPSGNGSVVRSVLTGSILINTGESREAEGKTWMAVKTENLQEGWVELAKTEKIDRPEGLRAGYFITFGHYEQDGNTANGKEAIEWQVLSVEEGRALVISKYGLDAKPYNEKNASVTWETCTLRTWLNGEFYNSAFSEAEKVQIQEVRVKNPNNATFGTKGGNDTTDRIFLLSIDEAKKYFTNDEARKCWPNTYAKNNGAYVRKDRALWWLRSPGIYAITAAIVNTDGSIFGNGSFVDGADGSARPAFWLNL